MKTIYIQQLSILLILLALVQGTSNAQSTAQDKTQKPATEQQKNTVKYKVTFIELGSVRCIPCQKMQPVMKSIEKKYSNQVKVVFHDVWTPEGKPFAVQHSIESIPTQVFLDENGKEFSRHVGYFPEEQLTKVLNSHGVN